MDTEGKTTEEMPKLSSLVSSPSEADWGWLAGIIEGEGTICLRRYNGTSSGSLYGAYIMITNTDRELIEKASRLCGGLRIKLQRPPNKAKPPFIMGRKPLYFVRTDNAKRVLEILEKVFPYMAGRKREVAKLAIKFCRIRVALTEKEEECRIRERDIFQLYRQISLGKPRL